MTDAEPEPTDAVPSRVPDGAHKPPPLTRWMAIAGWYGVVAILGAYWALSTDWLGNGVVYQLLNLTGAAAISIVSFKRHAWQPLALNVLWAVIAAYALWAILVGPSE